MSDSNLPSKAKQHKERNAFLQQIADFTPELLFVIDLAGLEIIYVNDKVEQLLGHNASFVYEQGHEVFKKVLHPDDYQRRIGNLKACRQLPDQQEAEVEVRFKSADGNWNWFRIREKVFKRNDDGAVLQTIGIAQNIHQQKVADERLQEEHRRLKDAQAIGHIGSFERALPGELVICSEEFLHIHGLELSSGIINTHQFMSCVHPDDREKFLEAVKRTHTTGEPLNLVNRIVRPDGSVRYVHRRSEIIKNTGGTPTRVYGTIQDITAQKKAEQEIIQVKDEFAQQLTDKYLTLFNSINEGFCIIELIFNEEQKPIDYRYIDINPVFEQQTGLKEARGKSMRELVPDLEPFWYEIYGKVALSGEPTQFENNSQTMGRWFEVKAFRISKPEDRQVAVIFNDITDRKRQEENMSFLAEIQDDFTRFTEADEIMHTVGEKMYHYFDAARLTMSNVDEAADKITPIFEKQAPHLKKTALEPQRLSDFVNDSFKREFKARSIVAINNISTDPRTADQVETYKALGVGSQLHTHYIRQDLWCFIITLQKEVPYTWRPDEMELLQEISTRLYLRIERALAEAAMRKSEAKYRDLFNSIEQGFAITEVIFDENNSPFDYRILEVNPRFQTLTGISREEALSGKTIREIKPGLEEEWYQYGRVVQTGEPLQFEEQSRALENRWFEVNVFPTDGTEGSRMAVLFNEITDRKKAEERIRQQNAVLEGINTIFREALSSQTEEELGRVCLNVIEEVTGSRIGFMGEINPKTGKLDDIAISDRSWEEFGVKDTSSLKKQLPVGLKIHGIYGRVLLDKKGFFTNKPASHPDSIGTPKSHPELVSFLGVPLIQAGNAIGMIGLANREGGYRTEDLEMAEALAPAIVQAFLRKRAEKALRKSEKQFRAVVDLVPDLLWSNDPQGIIDWRNRQWLEYTGQSSEEANDSSWINVVHPDDQDYTQDAFQTAITAGEALRTECRLHRHDGLYRWFLLHTRPMKDEGGKIVRWYGTATDIHKERMALETLRHSEEQFRFMADTIPQLLWITDAKGKVDFTNQVFLNYTGARKTPSHTREMADLFLHPEDVPVTTEKWKESLKSGKTFIVEHRVRSAQGEYRWFLVRAEPFVDPASGKIQHWFGTSTDIQEKKLSEEALIRAKEEAEKAARAKEEFLSTMSHEIRTPLNAVVGFTHLLLQQKPREDQKESLNGLSYSSRNLISLINDILDFSKIEAGKVELEENLFDILDLMFSLKQAHQADANENNTQLKLSLDDEIPEFILGDELKLSQVLHNLLGNAVKFTHQGLVRLEVSLRKQEGKNIWLDFSVEDTGIGIAEEKIPIIFEKFSQADSSTIRNYGGTGLGLTITKLLLELMDSQIEVESQEGIGSRFYFTLPLKAGAPPTSQAENPAQAEEERNLEQLNILLVEDVYLNRVIIAKFLKEWWGLVPDEAVNGKEAVEKVKHKNYDIILMDVRMPEMNGYEATRLIRSLTGKETIPVIALTADTGQDIQLVPEAVYFTDVITKPFNPEDLRRTILKHLPPLPEKRSMEALLGEDGQQTNFQEVESYMEEDPEEAKAFYKLTSEHLKDYKNTFKEAILERDLKKFSDMKHKSTILIDTFRFDDLKVFLQETQSLLREKALTTRLRKALKKGENLFDQKIKDVHKRQEQQ